jgi:hypothetical protein
MNFKHIFGTLNNFNQNLFSYKVSDCIEIYTFSIDHINIRGCSKLNFKFQNT